MNQKDKKIVLYIVIFILTLIIIGMIGVLTFLLKGKGETKQVEDSVTTKQETTVSQTTHNNTIETTTPQASTQNTAKEEQKEIQAPKEDFDSIIQIIKDNYYGIQNNLSDFIKVDTGGDYQRWDDKKGVMRKIVVPSGGYDFTDKTVEYYYNADRMLQFAFLYDGAGNQYRYYFYNNQLYRYIDASGNITDYKNGEDPYITEEIGTIYSYGEREKTF